MALTQATKTAILKSLLGLNQYGIISPCYIGLSIARPNPFDGSGFVEPWTVVDQETQQEVSTGYERCLIGSVGSGHTTQSMTVEDGRAYNNATIMFGETEHDYKEPVVAFGIFNNEKTGTPFIVGELDTPVEVKKGQMAIFSKSTNFLNGNLKFSIVDAVAFDVTFEPNAMDGTAFSDQAIANGQYKLPTAEDCGFSSRYLDREFKGWDTNKDATTPSYRAGDSITVTGDMTLYAIMGPKSA